MRLTGVRSYTSDSFYTTLCNAMDYTTSVFPVTHVDSARDVPHEPHDFYNHEDEAIYRLCACGNCCWLCLFADSPLLCTLDNTDLFSGCPVGLQLIGRTLEEEAVLRMTYIVDEALKRYSSGGEHHA